MGDGVRGGSEMKKGLVFIWKEGGGGLFYLIYTDVYESSWYGRHSAYTCKKLGSTPPYLTLSDRNYSALFNPIR